MFEELFTLNCRRENLAFTRFPNGCKSVGKNKLVQVKTPCDWIITHHGKTFLIDTKTTDQASFPHSKITAHQVAEMLKHELHGAIAGYIIWIRKPDIVYFTQASYLHSLIGIRGSIQPGPKTALLGTSKRFTLHPMLYFS